MERGWSKLSTLDPPARSPSNIRHFTTGVRRYHEKWAKRALEILSNDPTKLSVLKTSGELYEDRELYERNKFLEIRLVCQMTAVLIGQKRPEDYMMEWGELKDTVEAIQSALVSGKMEDIGAGVGSEECFRCKEAPRRFIGGT